MAWVWSHPKEDDEWGADLDIRLCPPMKGTEFLGDKRLDPAIYRPVFKSKTGLKKFKKLHCPPMDGTTAVDAAWRCPSVPRSARYRDSPAASGQR